MGAHTKRRRVRVSLGSDDVAALAMVFESLVMVCVGKVIGSAVFMVVGVAGLAFAGGIVYARR